MKPPLLPCLLLWHTRQVSPICLPFFLAFLFSFVLLLLCADYPRIETQAEVKDAERDKSVKKLEGFWAELMDAEAK
jgi:hypothetical protein